MKKGFIIGLLLMGIAGLNMAEPLSVSAETLSQNQMEAEASYITIDEQNFPDSAFRNYLVGLDEDGDGKLVVEDITNISIDEPNVENLKGIEHFTNVDSIYLARTKCTEVDLRSNTKLTALTVTNNVKLKKLDIGVCNDLEEFYCCYNSLEQLDVSGCPNLIYLECFDNELRYLDVSKNIELKSLLCSNNQLICLDISNNPYIRVQQISYFESFSNTRYCYEDYLDLSAEPGFDISRVSNWSGGELDGNILRPSKDSNTVSYSYDIGRERESDFTIRFIKKDNTEQKDDQADPVDDADQTGQEPDTWIGKQGVSGFVLRLYNVAMGREADDDGFMKWTDKLTTGQQSAAEVAQGFFFSEEFLNRNYNDEQYVRLLYRTMFGREADESGLNGWLSDLENAMSREYVYRGFVESQEFQNLCDTYGVERGKVALRSYRDKNKGATGFIARLYTKMLGRKYEDKGLEYWCKEYLTGKQSIEQIATNGFLHSEELTNQNLSDEEFVTRMYETFLNREPEEAGLKDWVGRLQSGKTTRDKLVYGFTNSQEFGNIKAAYGLK